MQAWIASAFGSEVIDASKTALMVSPAVGCGLGNCAGRTIDPRCAGTIVPMIFPVPVLASKTIFSFWAVAGCKRLSEIKIDVRAVAVCRLRLFIWLLSNHMSVAAGTAGDRLAESYFLSIVCFNNLPGFVE